MNPSPFVKPSPDELVRLVKKESRRSIYTGALALIQDVLCEFSASRVGPQFQDDDFRMQRLSEITSPIGGISALIPGDLIQNNLVENLGVALELQKRARKHRGVAGRKALRAEIESFLDSLEETYRDILILMSGGSKASRVKRA